MMTIRSSLLQAKLSWHLVTIQTDDGDQLTGMVEDITQWTVKLRQIDRIMFVPVFVIVSASMLPQLGDG
ncbi:MAG: hypothetical protein ACQEXQ_21675 [Bacillota bacterium]